MKVTRFYHFVLSIIQFIMFLALGIAAILLFINIKDKSSNALIQVAYILLAVVCFIIAIYELIIIVRLLNARKGKVIEAKYVSVKRKFVLFETIEFEVKDKKIQVSPLLFLRSYEVIYRNGYERICLVEHNNKYFVAYK